MDPYFNSKNDEDYNSESDAETLGGPAHGHEDDIVIAMMGSTGTGKSSFIQLLTGNTSVKVGNNLESETSEIQVIHFFDEISGRNVTIVDTPGFDDSRSGVSDTDILKTITDFLLYQYDENRKLNGLVYLQRISDPRFSGQSNRNLRMFRSLCGTETFKNVVILTTFWDRLDSKETGIMREEELKSKFFKDLVVGGARFMRYDRTIESCQQLLGHVFTLSGVTPQISKEIREEGKILERTAAGAVQREEVERIIAKHESEVGDLKAEMEAIKESNTEARRKLEEERAEIQQSLARWERERLALKTGLDDERQSRRRWKWGESWIQGFGDGQSAQLLLRRGMFRFTNSEKYPPYLQFIPLTKQTNITNIFNFTALAETTATLFITPALLFKMRGMAPDVLRDRTMEHLVTRNNELHTKSQDNARRNLIPSFKRDMYFSKNIGHRDDWYKDAVFGQQQFTGTNPTTITLAPRRWIDEFITASHAQQRDDVTRLLKDESANLYIQDYSEFRSAMGTSPSAEFTTEGRYGCSSVVLFRLEPEGKLHPLAITLDYKRDMQESVTIFNHRITSMAPGDESVDWPWRYAKMCAQVSDWLLHEVTVHLVRTHLVEEVIIVAAHRTFEPSHIIFKLLEPHWSTTLSLNKAARETLVPKIIIGMTGFTATQTYAFLKDAYNKFEWTNSYVPNDLRRRGFPIEDLDKPKYHNYGYARCIARIWDILRKFVATALKGVYPNGDVQVENDRCITAFCQEVRSQSGGQLSSFPDIKTLDELIDFVTMCIHIASPQHTAVNYLQQYYLTFVPNKPSALYTRLPQSLADLQKIKEKDILFALPIHKPKDWLIMAQVPYLLSFEMPDDTTILHYASTTPNSRSTPEVIRNAARVLKDDLKAFIHTVNQYSQELDDQRTPYLVLDPSKTAISILI